jgi:hypothetical protein
MCDAGIYLGGQHNSNALPSVQLKEAKSILRGRLLDCGRCLSLPHTLVSSHIGHVV